MGTEYVKHYNATELRYRPDETVEGYRERIFNYFSGRVDEGKLTDSPAKDFLKDYIVPEGEREQRRMESYRARRALTEIYTSTAGRPDVKFIDNLPRADKSLTYYFQKTGQTELQERFEQLFRVPEPEEKRIGDLVEQGVSKEEAEKRVRDDDIRIGYERGRFLADMMERYNSYTPEKLLTMKYDEIYKKLPEINLVYSIAMNIEPDIDAGPDAQNKNVIFTPEDHQRIKFLKELYLPSGNVMSRLYMKQNPYSELLDTDRMLENMKLEDGSKCLNFTGDETHFGNLMNDAAGGVMNRHNEYRVRLIEELGKNGIDIKQPETVTLDEKGERIDLDDIFSSDYVKNGGKIYAMQGDVAVKTGFKTENGQLMVETKPTDIEAIRKRDGELRADVEAKKAAKAAKKAAEAAKKAAEKEKRADENLKQRNEAFPFDVLNSEMKNADPWYVHSSDEFRAMKHRFEELRAMGGSLSDNPEVRARQEAKLNELKAASEAYLAYKGENGKNDLEKNRIALAHEILHMTESKLDYLDQPRREAEAAKARAAEEARALREEAPNAQRLEEKSKAFSRLTTLPGTHHMSEINGVIEGFGRELAAKFDPNTLNQPINRSAVSHEKIFLDHLMVKALLLNDQAGRTAEKPGLVTGVLNELPIIKPFLTTMHSLPSYKKALETMTKKDLYDFVVQGDVKHLAQELREDINAMAHKKEQPQAAPQMQHDAPQKEQQGRHI